jgi:hypothetical protein
VLVLVICRPSSIGHLAVRLRHMQGAMRDMPQLADPSHVRALALCTVDAARTAGAAYVDVRLTRTISEHFYTDIGMQHWGGLLNDDPKSYSYYRYPAGQWRSGGIGGRCPRVGEWLLGLCGQPALRPPGRASARLTAPTRYGRSSAESCQRRPRASRYKHRCYRRWVGMPKKEHSALRPVGKGR